MSGRDPLSVASELAGLLASTDPLGDAKVGDLAPAECLNDNRPCKAIREYICTRDLGHDGQHIATDDREVLEVWTS